MQKLAVAESDVAQATGISTDTLKRLRRRGGGPPWLRVGKSVRYPVADLRRWMAEQQQAAHDEEQAGA